MYATTRRHFIAGAAAAITIAGSMGHAAAAQSDDLPGLRSRTFTSNFFDHDLAWSRDWRIDQTVSLVNEEARRESIVLRDDTVDADDNPPVISFSLTAVDASFSLDEFIANLPTGSIDSPNYPPKAFVFGDGRTDDGAWFVWGWEPDDDEDDPGRVTLVQYVYPQQAGDPLISLGIIISGQHVEQDLIERIEDDIEFDGGSYFVFADHEELWDVIAEVY
jgi:hypothetical protein